MLHVLFFLLGVLLYGPPGCSKTMIAKALATETGISFVSLHPSDIFKRYVGESEAKMREVLMRARASAPTILFVDEIDTLLPARGEGSVQLAGERFDLMLHFQICPSNP